MVPELRLLQVLSHGDLLPDFKKLRDSSFSDSRRVWEQRELSFEINTRGIFVFLCCRRVWTVQCISSLEKSQRKNSRKMVDGLGFYGQVRGFNGGGFDWRNQRGMAFWSGWLYGDVEIRVLMVGNSKEGDGKLWVCRLGSRHQEKIRKKKKKMCTSREIPTPQTLGNPYIGFQDWHIIDRKFHSKTWKRRKPNFIQYFMSKTSGGGLLL